MNLFIRKKAYTFMDRYDVLDEQGRMQYTMDGKITVFGGSLTLRDAAGTELVKLKRRSNPFFGNYVLYDLQEEEGTVLAHIKQKFSIRPRFEMQIWNETYKIRGNLRGCDYDVFNSDDAYALVRKRTLRWGNTYVLSLQDLSDAPVFCSLVAGVDAALFPGNRS